MARTDSIISRLPHFFQSGDTFNTLYQYIKVFGQQTDIAEEDLIRVMRSHWVNTANNEDSKGFDTSEKGDLDKIFSLYVEALGGTSLLKQAGRRNGADGIEDDKIYRDRIKGLIKVLRNGASTQEGIIAIVAANLGVVGNTKAAEQAKSTIRVEEFLPELAPWQHFQVALYQEFLVDNPNYVDVVPQVRVTVMNGLPTPLVNPTLVNLMTGERAQYTGTILQNEELNFLTDGTAFHNGTLVTLDSPTPAVRPGINWMRIEAGYGMPEGYFDINRWDFARFEQDQVVVPGRFNEATFDECVFTDGTPLLDVDVSLTKFTPGTFMVRIPWDIPGYTDILDTLADKPRQQIRFIVDKVKAAGTFAVITYEKTFTEEQPMTDALTIVDYMPIENQDMQELDFMMASVDYPYPSGLVHEHADSLTLSGMFDYTKFDTLNTFA